MSSPRALEASDKTPKPDSYRARRKHFHQFKQAPQKQNRESLQTCHPKLAYHMTFRIGTLNCKGLKPNGSDVKQRLLINAMKKHNTGVLLLQETHIKTIVLKSSRASLFYTPRVSLTNKGKTLKT